MAFDLSKLGVEKNVPQVNFLAYTGIMSAPEKFGKTAFATLYPNSILLAAEKGYKAQVVNKRDINSWDDFVDFVDLLEDNREEIGDDVQTIIIDTVDELHPMAASYACRKYNYKMGKDYAEVTDIPHGQGWGIWDKEFRKQIKRILDMGLALLYLTHTTVKTIKPKDGEPYDVYKSTMSDRCANIVYPACDYIIHGERRKVKIDNKTTVMKRVLTVRGNDQAVAGNRVYFDDDIVFDTEEEAMEKFREKFREGIERNLRKAGIERDLEEIEQEQKETQDQEVKQYVESQRAEKNAPTLESSIQELNDLIVSLDDEGKKKAKELCKSILGTMNFKKATEVDKVLQVISKLNQ